MKKPIVWLFPGQGAHYFQMGRSLYEGDSVFRATVLAADEMLRPLIKASLADEMFRPREDRFAPFRSLRFTHPAILAMGYAMAQCLFARGMRPDRLAGHSLGELLAFVVAGSLTFEEALLAAVKQAQFLEYCAPSGGMLVVLTGVELFSSDPAFFVDCELAGVYSPRSFVVAGDVSLLVRARAVLRQRGIDTHELPVAYPFHTAAMDVVKVPTMSTLSGVPFKASKIPVYSIDCDIELATPSAEHFWAATRKMTEFPQAVRRLEETGPNLYVDLGPSGSMTTAVKYNLDPGAASELFPIITPFGQELRNLERLSARLTME
ncbi:MAG: acyltransferase domain-containing protein [Candidatus Synoicihabitans palmerolidicus]|nr:acyltransferase domain-containing protein [Candidatus Synoicihabitans palmerolidicus]MCC5025939.1 acyltransferase domain-containing protein [Candidatus Synoicihabitans palmerolidicus]MCC5025978.1 acyltransferase domain-containing protein [Candidatus Synoicihabitans palmerolidicus]MCC5026022.1 acyltransferase domain-containing protein [Candidatus Synoicihabitans palmerolidicus]MCC5026054.1 acyltransferase domain-containing protein [Candidatus Synoicihabitans palmerolidicus]